MTNPLWGEVEIFQNTGDWDRVDRRMRYLLPNVRNCIVPLYQNLYANWLMHHDRLEEADTILHNIPLNRNINTTFNCLKSLFYLYVARNNTDSIVYYSKRCIQYEDSIRKQADMAQGHIIDRLYNLKKAQQRENEALKEKIALTRLCLIALATLVMLSICLMYLRKRYVQRTNRLKNEIEIRKNELKKKENDNNRIRKNLKNVKERYNKLLLDNIQDNINDSGSNISEETYEKVKSIQKKYLSATDISTEDRNYIKEICGYCYPNWEKTLYGLFPKTSFNHIEVCMLTLMGFNQIMAANALHVKKQNIEHSYKMLNKHLGGIHSRKGTDLQMTLEKLYGQLYFL